MHAPNVPLSAWWGAAIAATVIFLVSFLPLMPDRSYRIRMFLTPAGMAGILALAAAVKKDMPLAVALSLYTAMVMVFVTGFIGRRTELRTKFLDLSVHGERPENALSVGAWLQLAVSLIVLMPLAIWLAVASS